MYYAFFGSRPSRNSNRNRFNVISNSPVDDYRRSRNVLFSNRYNDTVNMANNWSVKNSLKKLLRQVDGNSMAWSIESRQPFMDYRLVEFLNSLPDVYKLYGGWTKYISRVALKGKLPDRIIWRKDKKGWPMPLKEWVSGDVLLSMKKEILESRLIMDLSENHRHLKIDDYRLANLHKNALRYFIKYYNVARVGRLFFGY
jgi:asparagine synthetase B (glutamine-hydrolysing)